MHRFDRGILYFPNVTPFHCTSANVFSFWSITKERRFVQQPCIQFHKSRTTKIDSYLLNYLLAYLLTYLPTPRSTVLLEKLTGSHLDKKFPTFYGTRRFITSFTSARQLSLSWASSIQSIPPHHTSWRSKLILSSHLSLGLPSGLFPSGFLTKTLYTPLISPIRTTCPAHSILLDFITRKILGEQYRTLSSTLCSCLQSADTSSLLDPNIFLSICSYEVHIMDTNLFKPGSKLRHAPPRFSPNSQTLSIFLCICCNKFHENPRKIVRSEARMSVRKGRLSVTRLCRTSRSVDSL